MYIGGDTAPLFSLSVCIIAGDISPIDVISPLPVLCEDHNVPYMYVPSKEVWPGGCTWERCCVVVRACLLLVYVTALRYCTIHSLPPTQELGHAGLTKRSASCVLVLSKAGKGASGDDAAEFDELYKDVLGRVKSQQVLYNVR